MSDKLNSFTDSQIELVRVAKERGLDPDELFSGIITGLEQSIMDLLEQTNKVIKALIDQIERDKH